MIGQFLKAHFSDSEFISWKERNKGL